MSPERRNALRLLCWEGYDAPALLADFVRRHGAAVAADTLLSDFAAATDVADDPTRWDVANLNNPFARDFLHPLGLVRPLDRARFEPFFARMLPWLRPCYGAAWSRGGGSLLGVCQRFGPFNLVVDTRRISAAMAADQGFDLANQPGRFGILAYEDFNVFHVALGAGLNPFARLSEADFEAFAATARRWFTAASMVSGDHLALNRALVAGDIDFYVSGGIYTCSPARLDGHSSIRGVTPTRGPIGGKGGIVFLEITSVLRHAPALAEDFLAYMMEPQTAVHAALAAGACNPVTQLADPAVFGAFTAAQLSAMQWDDLEEQVGRCAEYALAPDYERLRSLLAAARGT